VIQAGGITGSRSHSIERTRRTAEGFWKEDDHRWVPGHGLANSFEARETAQAYIDEHSDELYSTPEVFASNAAARMKKIELIDKKTSTILGTVNFLKVPVGTYADFICGGTDKRTREKFRLDQAQRISRAMMPTDKHEGRVKGDVPGVEGMEWREVKRTTSHDERVEAHEDTVKVKISLPMPVVPKGLMKFLREAPETLTADFVFNTPDGKMALRLDQMTKDDITTFAKSLRHASEEDQEAIVRSMFSAIQSSVEGHRNLCTLFLQVGEQIEELYRATGFEQPD
jgi:hypothetical protein